MVVRAAEAQRRLELPDSLIGAGTRATVLFHEPAFDSAMILLEPGGAEMAERNTSGLPMLYFVLECEDDQVEFEVEETGRRQRLTSMSEVLVPAEGAYALRNLSESRPAKLIAVVPRATS